MALVEHSEASAAAGWVQGFVASDRNLRQGAMPCNVVTSTPKHAPNTKVYLWAAHATAAPDVVDLSHKFLNQLCVLHGLGSSLQ